jgi:hypothetical protein
MHRLLGRAARASGLPSTSRVSNWVVRVGAAPAWVQARGIAGLALRRRILALLCTLEPSVAGKNDRDRSFQPHSVDLEVKLAHSASPGMSVLEGACSRAMWPGVCPSTLTNLHAQQCGARHDSLVQPCRSCKFPPLGLNSAAQDHGG